MASIVKVWDADKRVVVNNFLKHFFFSLLLFGLIILIEFLQFKSVTLDSELLVLLFMFIVDLLLAGKKALEEYNAEWAEDFQWIWQYLYRLFKILLDKILKK
jgi:hypothetical protein